MGDKACQDTELKKKKLRHSIVQLILAVYNKTDLNLKAVHLCAEFACSSCVGLILPQAKYIQVSDCKLPVDASVRVVVWLCWL